MYSRRPGSILGPRAFCLALGLALLALPLGLPNLASADTKTFEAQNVKWTLPDDWSWREVPAEAKKNGYAAMAETAGADAALVALASDLTIEEFAPELAQVLRQQLGEATQARTDKAKLSGVDGIVVRAKGNSNGQDVYGQAWAIKAEGRLTVWIVRSVDGAERKKAGSIDAARRGVRLLKGAGAEEEPNSDAPPSFDGDEMSAAGGADASGNDEITDANWPEKGPKREGNVITFEPYNLRVTLPEDTKFKIVGVMKDVAELSDEGRRPTVALILRHAPSETESVRTLLLIRKRQGTTKPSDLVQNSGLQQSLGNAIGRPLPGTTKIEEDAETDSLRSSWIEMVGRGSEEEDAEGYKAIQWRGFVNAGWSYSLESEMVGPKRNIADTFRRELDALAEGLAPLTGSSPAAIPLAGAVAASFEARGTHLDAEKTIKGPRFAFEKPKGTARLRPEAGGINLAVEARSEDGAHAIYMDYSTVKMSELGNAGRTMEDLAKDRGSAWETAAEGMYKLHPREKEDWIKKAAWGRAKGVGWEFSATLDGQPIVEHGFVVKHKQTAYIIRVQFAGENAEKVMGKVYKAWKKKWKWSR